MSRRLLGVRESDPRIIDSIGIGDTVRLAEEWFCEIAADYLEFWLSSTKGDSEEFGLWCRKIGVLIVTEIGKLWGSDQWHAEWFDRACRQKIEHALVPRKKEWTSRATDLEIQRLENANHQIVTHLIDPCDSAPRDGLVTSDGGLAITNDVEEILQPKDALMNLLDAVLAKKALTVEGWAQGHRFGRTMVFDWKAARSRGKSSKDKVSLQKCSEIEQAIENDAAELGLNPD